MRKTAICTLVLCFLGTWTAIAGQTAKPVWKGTITIENGIMVVKNPREPLYRGEILRLQEELSIGRGEKPGEFYFNYIGSPLSSLVVDEQGFIFALDVKDYKVKVFSPDGRFVRAFSQKGQGPGDLDMPYQIFLTPKGEIVVESVGTHMLHFFSKEGRFLRRQNWSPSEAAGFVVFPDESLLGLSITHSQDKNPILRLKLFTSDMRLLRELEQQPYAGYSPILFRPGSLLYQVTSRGEILTGYTEIYEVKTLDLLGQTKRIVKNIDRQVPVTKEDVDAVLKNQISRNGPAPEWIIPKTFLPYFIILPDEDGRIFTASMEKTKDREAEYWDIFDAEGRYIGRQAFPRRLQLWKHGKLYSIETDEEGNQYIKRYSAHWLY